MDTKTALGAAGGLTLTVVGAVSALALTFGGGTSVLGGADETPNTPVVEVVDQYGNPIDLQQPAPSAEIVVTEGAASDAGLPTAAQEGMRAETSAAYDEAAYEEEEYVDDEAEDGEYDEEYEDD